jgi:hypothetical protein
LVKIVCLITGVAKEQFKNGRDKKNGSQMVRAVEVLSHAFNFSQLSGNNTWQKVGNHE